MEEGGAPVSHIMEEGGERETEEETNSKNLMT
jgi:hypothetical protein